MTEMLNGHRIPHQHPDAEKGCSRFGGGCLVEWDVPSLPQSPLLGRFPLQLLLGMQVVQQLGNDPLLAGLGSYVS